MALNRTRWRRHLTLAAATAATVVLGSTASSLLPPSRPVGSSPSGAWSVVSSPDPGSSTYASLSAVTCTSPSNCWAVGTYTAGGSSWHTLAEQYDGTAWAVATIPTPTGATSVTFSAVACTSPSNCWAVGSNQEEGSPSWHTLTERYDGSGWSIVASPDPSGADDSYLVAVACASAGDCWAVGSYDTDSGHYTLTEQYSGSAWSIVSSPNPSSSGALLTAVACISASDCWAVGSSYDLGSGLSLPQAFTLAEQYNGTAWSIVSSPTRGGSISVALPAVACASASDCWAVGSYEDSSLDEGTLAEEYNGTAWSIVASPNPAGETAVELAGVACTGDGDCWSIGSYDDSGSDEHTLAEYYDGSAWTVVASPTPGGTGGESVGLSGVVCTGTSNCWAVGSYDDSSLAAHTLVEQYEALGITSPGATTFTVGSAGTFTVTTTGCWPTPTLSDGGAALPSGVTFTDNGNGTATLAGTPSTGSGGTYSLTVTASNGVAPDATQDFTLSVMSPTSLTASATPGAAAYGTPITLSATGLPAGATGTVTFTDQGADTLCSASVSGGSASCQSSAALASGPYTVTASYPGDSAYEASGASTSFTLTPDPVLQVSTSGTPSSIQAGDGYTLSVGASLGASGGPAYHDPTLTVSLPLGETFAGDATSAWICSVSGASTELTCISTAATPINAGASLGSVAWVVNVSSTAAGPLQTTIAVTDAGDLAAAESVTAALSSVPATSPPTPATGSRAGGTPPWAPAVALLVAGLALLVWRRRILTVPRRSR
jgi:hypothetical protein